MQRKPIILILTSRDEIDGVSQRLQDVIQNLGTHNVVVVSDEKYGSPKKMTRLDKFMYAGREYQYLLEKKDMDVLRDKFKMKPLSKRANRINNAVIRYTPEYILTVTPYAHHSAVEAKKHLGFKTPIIFMMLSFTLDNRNYDSNTSLFLVENADVKEDLVKRGIRSKEIVTLGMPFMLKKLSPPEIVAEKQELGLPRSKTVFVNVSDKDDMEEIVTMLADQGDILNLVVYGEESREFALLRSHLSTIQSFSSVFVTKRELLDGYLLVSDIIITKFDVSIIYKGFMAEIPVITIGYGEDAARDTKYLVEKGLVFQAKDNIDVISLLYKLMQTGATGTMTAAGAKWVELCSIDNIANFLVSQ